MQTPLSSTGSEKKQGRYIHIYLPLFDQVLVESAAVTVAKGGIMLPVLCQGKVLQSTVAVG